MKRRPGVERRRRRLASEIELLEAKFKAELEKAIEEGGSIDLGNFFISKNGQLIWRASGQKVGVQWEARLERIFGDINKANAALSITSTHDIRTVDADLLKMGSALASALGDLFEVEFYNAMIDEAKRDPLKPAITQETQMKGFGSTAANFKFTQADLNMVRTTAKTAAALAYPQVRRDVFSIIGMGGSQKIGDVKVNGVVFELKYYSQSTLNKGIHYFSLTDTNNFQKAFSNFLLELGDPYWNLKGEQIPTSEWVNTATTEGFRRYVKEGEMTGTKHNVDTLRYLLQKGNVNMPLSKKKIITAVKYVSNAIEVSIDFDALIGELSQVKLFFDQAQKQFIFSGIANSINQEMELGTLSIDSEGIKKHSHGTGENTRGWSTTFYLNLKKQFISLGLSK